MALNNPTGNEESFIDRYGEPSGSIQGIGQRMSNYENNPAYNGANTMGDTIPIDSSI